jgi:hypothetical protein
MNYTNVDSIIERVYKNSPPGVELNREDVVEWIWEAISKIGGVKGHYMELSAMLVIDEYRAKLPAYLEKVTEVSFVSNNVDEIDNPDLISKGYRLLMAEALETWFQDEPMNSPHKGTRYKIKNGYIYTTFEKGIVEVAYKSFPVDENLEPIVVTHVYVLEAITWYITMKCLWRAIVRDITYKPLYEEAKAQWAFYCNSAATYRMMPDIGEGTALNNKYLRIVPNTLWRNNTNRNSYIYPSVTRDQLNEFITHP